MLLTARKSLFPFALLLSLLLSFPLSLQAQERSRGSRYLPLGHPAYVAVQGLMDRGRLSGLNPLSQPYTRDQLARGVAALDESGLEGPEGHWAHMLRKELARELRILAGRHRATESENRHGRDEARPGESSADEGMEGDGNPEPLPDLGWTLLAGATASSSRRLDPLMPYREAGGAPGTGSDPGALGDREVGGWPYYAVGGWGEIGRFAVDVRLYHDLWMERDSDGDPDGLDPGGIAAFNRTDNAYLSARYNHGSVFVGRMRRNWAPLGSTGLMLSDVATTYPQLGFEIGGGGLQVEFMVGELEGLEHETGVEYRRWLVANRISYRRTDFAISIGEAKIAGKKDNGGPGFRYLNPAELFFFDDQGQPQDTVANVVLDGQLWFRRGNLVLYGEAMLDDIDVTPEEGKDREPLTYAMSLGARLSGVRPWLDLALDYRRVSAFAYRSLPPDQWSFLERGLGDPWSDYDRLTLAASVFPDLPGLRLTPTLAYQRKGEGDFRKSLPPNEEHLASPSIFLGTVESTARLGLRGRYHPNGRFFLDWDAGANFVRDAHHQAGESLTEFSWLVELGILMGG